MPICDIVESKTNKPPQCTAGPRSINEAELVLQMASHTARGNSYKVNVVSVFACVAVQEHASVYYMGKCD